MCDVARGAIGFVVADLYGCLVATQCVVAGVAPQWLAWLAAAAILVVHLYLLSGAKELSSQININIFE